MKALAMDVDRSLTLRLLLNAFKVGRGTTQSPASPVSSESTAKAEFNLMIGFFSGTARRPSDSELAALLIQLNVFLTQKIHDVLNDNAASLTASITEWHYEQGSETPVILRLDVQALHGNGTAVSPFVVYQALRLDSEGLSSLITQFVQKASPTSSGENVFVNTNQISFESHTVAGTMSTGTSVGKYHSLAPWFAKYF